MSVFAGPTLTWSQQEIQEDAGFFASGGTVTEITQNGVVYRVHSFITVGVSTLTVNRQLNNLEYLVVAGGGGGGYNNAGGGGAGGLLYGVESVNPNIITITVGDIPGGIDIVGEIWNDDGVYETDEETGEISVISEATKKDGWHVNVILASDLPEELQEFVVEPVTPSRRFAGF